MEIETSPWRRPPRLPGSSRDRLRIESDSITAPYTRAPCHKMHEMHATSVSWVGDMRNTPEGSGAEVIAQDVRRFPPL